MQSPHTKEVKEIFSELQTSQKGLSENEHKKRLAQYGKNKISKQKKASQILKFLKQFNSPLIYILFAATIISFIFNHLVDAYVILGVILINSIIGYVQERKAERAIESLEKLIVSYAKVFRNNELIKIKAEELVPGDIIFLEEGDKIPADARLIELKDFRTQEASLTGESLPSEKSLKIFPEKISIGDRQNMVFMGTLAVSGTAKAIVVNTANKTQIGTVAKSIQEVVKPQLHFNKKVSQIAFQMGAFAVIGASLIFLIGFFVDKLEFFDIFLFTTAALVSGIPEGLPAVLTIVLAVGAWRMAKRKAVIRHLPAVETLGVATVIATDKTGTLTQNKIMVQELVTPDGDFSISGEGYEPLGRFFTYPKKNPIHAREIPSAEKIFSISAISNKSNLIRKQGQYEIVGDPTEAALLVFAKKANYSKEKLKEKIIDDLAFNSELKFRATLVEKNNKKQIYSIGAFENILERSRYVLKSNRKSILNLQQKNEFLSKAESLASKGFRVLALAYKDVSNLKSLSSDDVTDLTLVAIVGMKDPPRHDVKDSIIRARNAGIRIIMKTGDHKDTALAIAEEIGLVSQPQKTKVLTEEDLEKMDFHEFRKAVNEVNIFARVTPKMKMKIVQTLQEQGEIVAMTGDGVNDAPALKRADIGIAMGIIGTDVARESSEIVLTDDNFSSIVNAIEEGRIVFQNVRQASFYLVSTNVGEHITLISSLLLKYPLPLLPIQILYMNLVTDTFNGIGLSMEPGHHDVLNKPPRNKKEMILNWELGPFVLLVGGLMALGTLPLYSHFLSQGIEKAHTIAFATMTLCQLFNVSNMRSLRKSVFRIGFFSNKWILYSITISLTGMLAVIYLPFINNIFRFTPLSISELLLVFVIASSVLIVGEIYKFVRFRKEE